MTKKEDENQTLFEAKDVSILRESLVWCFKRLPPSHQAKVDADLKRFAKNVSTYCKHDDTVFIDQEKTHACLNCGARRKSKNLEAVK